MGLTLREALGIESAGVVAFVGAGGKTTAMYRLARELRARGAGVLVTTTTKIFPPEPADDLCLIVEADQRRLSESIARPIGDGLIVVLGRGVTPQGKLDGIPPPWVGDLAAAPGVTHVLVEADGAARRPFTAPRAYEPVIPPSATVVVPVVGVEVLGQRLSADVAHRPERVQALTGVAEGEPIDARAIATVMLHAEGNTKGAPTGASIVPLVNKADTPGRLDAAWQVAGELRRLGARRIVIAAVAGKPPVVAVVGPGSRSGTKVAEGEFERRPEIGTDGMVGSGEHSDA